MEEQPLWVLFNCISSNLSGNARWASHACCSHVEICLYERLWIHSNSVCSSFTGKDHYLGPTDTAQYHLRRIGREFLLKARRLPLMMTDLMRARRRSDIKRISLFYLSPSELFSTAHRSPTGHKISFKWAEGRPRKAWAGKTTLFLSFRYQRRPE